MVFFYLDVEVVKVFSALGRWPIRLLFDFCTEPKDIVLEVTVPAGTRIGITSWHEVVSLDAIPPEFINPARS